MDFLSKIDLIIPVPLHKYRLFTRKFNQSALLAGALSAECGIESNPFILKRIKHTRTQGGLSRAQRQRNVRAAFAVEPGQAARVAKKSLLLVDDVYTTGATVDNCTLALQKAGAKTIYVLTLARVVEPGGKKYEKNKNAKPKKPKKS